LTLNVLNLLFNVQSIAFPLWRRDTFNMISETPLAVVAGGVFCKKKQKSSRKEYRLY
jgi:hypothetical protein